MTPKKIMIFALTLASIFSAIYLPLTTTKQKNEDLPIKEQNNVVTNTKFYVIKSNNGKISVYSSEQNEPLYTLDSPYVRDLPESDQELLEKGMIANSKEEVIKILEDYDY